jgi:hypothetical protein
MGLVGSGEQVLGYHSEDLRRKKEQMPAGTAGSVAVPTAPFSTGRSFETLRQEWDGGGPVSGDNSMTSLERVIRAEDIAYELSRRSLSPSNADE